MIEKKLDALHRIANVTVIAAAFSHVFCCGLPTLLSIASLTSIFGSGAAGTLHMAWFEAIEPQILIASGLVLFISGMAQLISWRIKCNTQVCHHGPCDKRKNWALRLFVFATTLYLFNLFVLLFLH